MSHFYVKILYLILFTCAFQVNANSQELVDDSTGEVANSANPKVEVKLREKLATVKTNIERELRLESSVNGIKTNVTATGKGFVIDGDVPTARVKSKINEIASQNSEGIAIIDQMTLIEEKSDASEARSSTSENSNLKKETGDEANVNQKEEGEKDETAKSPSDEKSGEKQEKSTTVELKKRDDVADKIMKKKQIEDRKERKNKQE